MYSLSYLLIDNLTKCMYNVCMISYTLYLTKLQVDKLKSISDNGISVSEHIRRAIDSYLSKIILVSSSISKGGEKYGRIQKRNS